MGYLLFILPALALGWGIFEAFDDDDDTDEAPVEETGQNDVIDGTDGADRLDGKAGNDLIRGLAGNDDMEGGQGDDTVRGDAGDDIVLGQQGDDDLAGGDGNDLLFGGTGDDVVVGDGGDDWIEGNQGDDRLRGGTGFDLLIGGAGADDLQGGTGGDLLIGGTVEGLSLTKAQLIALRDGTPLEDILGPDAELTFRDDGAVDTLNGGAGDDALFLGAGDIGRGGAGADFFAILQDQEGDAGPAIIDGLDPGDEVAIVPVKGTNPVVTVTDDGADAVIRADDVVVGRVIGGAGLRAIDIVILSETETDALVPSG